MNRKVDQKDRAYLFKRVVFVDSKHNSHEIGKVWVYNDNKKCEYCSNKSTALLCQYVGFPASRALCDHHFAVTLLKLEMLGSSLRKGS